MTRRVAEWNAYAAVETVNQERRVRPRCARHGTAVASEDRLRLARNTDPDALGFSNFDQAYVKKLVDVSRRRPARRGAHNDRALPQLASHPSYFFSPIARAVLVALIVLAILPRVL